MASYCFIAVVLFCGCDKKDASPSPAPAREAPSAQPAGKDQAAQTTNDKDAVAAARKALDAWVSAQNQGNVEAYLALYDQKTFRGVTRTNSGGEKKLDFAAWKDQRSGMVKSGMTVAADAPKTVSWAENPGLGAGVVEIRFTQRWKNPRYADHGPKVVHFRVENGKALIIYEELISSSVGWDNSGGAATIDPNQCTGQGANSELPCTLGDGRTGWCKGGKCKDICPAGLSYNWMDTKCHKILDCKAIPLPDGTIDMTPTKTAQCNQCTAGYCFDEAAMRDVTP